jgi:leader peptidase (prepilin peptidase)/N-methyltransferase
MRFLANLTLPPGMAATAFASGAILAGAAWVWGPVDQHLASVVLAFTLAWAAAIDIDRFLLPNALTLGLIVLGLALAALGGAERTLASAVGAGLGYASLAGLAFLYRRVRKRDGLGLGDAKLFAAAGAWMGWMALPVVLLVASFAAMIVVVGGAIIHRRFDSAAPMAFGPFIAAGFYVAWTFDPLSLVRGLP